MARVAVRICGRSEEEKGDDSSPNALASFFFVAQDLTTDRTDPPDHVRVDIEQQMQTWDGSITP